MSKEVMRVLIADDQPQVRSALSLLLKQEPGVTVVGETAEAGDLLAQVEAIRPDLVLLDWELRDRCAAAVLGKLRAVRPEVAVIVLSGRPEVRQAALAAGADAFVSKGDPPERLLAAVGDLYRGEDR